MNPSSVKSNTLEKRPPGVSPPSHVLPAPSLPKVVAFDDHLQTARDVSEPVTMVRYLQSGISETRGKLAEFLEPPADAVFREVELEVRREQFVRKPSVVDLFEMRLGGFDQQC
jgi:hypothetical protein